MLIVVAILSRICESNQKICIFSGVIVVLIFNIQKKKNKKLTNHVMTTLNLKYNIISTVV